MKHDVDVLERLRKRALVANIGVQELRTFGYPLRLAVWVRLPFERIEDAHAPTFSQQQVGEVGTNEPRATGYECAFHCKAANDSTAGAVPSRAIAARVYGAK